MKIITFLFVIITIYQVSGASWCMRKCNSCTQPCSGPNKNKCKRVRCMYACLKGYKYPCKAFLTYSDAELVSKRRVLTETETTCPFAQDRSLSQQEELQFQQEQPQFYDPRELKLKMREEFPQDFEKCEVRCNKEGVMEKQKCLTKCMDIVLKQLE